MVCGTGTTHLCWCIHAGTNLHDPSPISLTRYCTLHFIHSIFLRISRKISHRVNCVSAALRPHFQPLLHLRYHYCSNSGTHGYHFACSHQVWVQISIAYNVNGIDRILHFRFCLTPLMLILLQPLQAITNTLEDHICGRSNQCRSECCPMDIGVWPCHRFVRFARSFSLWVMTLHWKESEMLLEIWTNNESEYSGRARTRGLMFT